MGSWPSFIQTSVRGGGCAFGFGVGGRGVQCLQGNSYLLTWPRVRGFAGQGSVHSEMGPLLASRMDCEIPGVGDGYLTPRKPSLSKDTT